MKKPSSVSDMTSQNQANSVVIPPLNYLEGLKNIDPKLLDEFMQQSRLNLELLNRREDKNLELKYQLETERLKLESEKAKLNHKEEMQPHINRKLELFGGFLSLTLTFAFIAYLITINRTDIASLFTLFLAVAAVLSAFIKKDKKP